MDIKRQIWSVPLVSTLIFAAGVGASAWLASEALDSIHTTGSVNYPVLDQAKSLSGEIGAVTAALRDAVSEGDKARVTQVDEQASAVRRSLARFGALAGEADNGQRLGAEFTAYYRPALASARIMLELEKGDASDSVKAMQGALAILNADLEQTNARAARQFTTGIARSEERVNRVLWSSIMAALAVIASLVLVSHIVVRSIWRQLGGEPEYAREIAHAVAAGDLSMDIRTESGDDTSLLAALREMRKRLATMVSGIKQSADTIHLASAEIAHGNADLASRTEAQAGSLEHTTRAMDTLIGTVRQNALHAGEANTLVRSASDDAGRGGSAVNEVVATMGDISAAARKIVDIIGVIDGIAFQTNILALNAAVEAARAGEQGRGFAVVASEVRTLAQRSAAAAREIKTVIVATVEQVEAGALQVDRAGATMNQIVASVARVAAIMGDISSASQSQIMGLDQIGSAIGRIDGMTQQNSALVEEAAAAADSLTDQAEQLAQALGNFKLGRGA